MRHEGGHFVCAVFSDVGLSEAGAGEGSDRRGEEAVRIQREVQARDPGYVHGARYLFEALAGLGFVYGETGAKDKACRLAREAQTFVGWPVEESACGFGSGEVGAEGAPGCGS